MKEDEEVRVAQSILMKLLSWIKPELKEMYPEPGSFSGFFLLFPPLWFQIF